MATVLQGGRLGFPGAELNIEDGPLLSPFEMAALAWAPRTAGAVAAPQGQPRPAGARQFWNLPAKFTAASQIYQEELHRIHGHNNAGDAMRHAEASRRLADAAGPMFTAAAGLGHEVIDSLPSFIPGGHSQPLSEGLMDLMNNADGIDASVHGVAIDPGKLQARPLSLTGAYGKANQTYQNTSPDTGAYNLSPGGGYPYRPGGGVQYDPELRFPPY